MIALEAAALVLGLCVVALIFLLTVLDLFSGIGGISLGLESTGGFQTIAFCELEEFPKAVLRKHWPGVPIHDDVRRLTADSLGGLRPDCIVGGFPCQDISVAGKGAGLGGNRSGLWSEYARLVGEFRPRWVVAENVGALRTRGVDRVCSDLEGEGYSVWPLLVGAWAVGAPHKRERVWIVAANTHEKGLQGQRFGRNPGKAAINDKGGLLRGSTEEKDSADTIGGIRPLGRTTGRMGWCESAQGLKRWEVTSEPFVRRGTHGIPDRMDRLRALGNSVVPAVVQAIGQAILTAEAGLA